MAIAEEDVLCGWRKGVYRLLAAPLELSGVALYECWEYVTPDGKVRAYYEPVKSAWRAFISRVSRRLTREAQRHSEWHQRLMEKAAAGDENARAHWSLLARAGAGEPKPAQAVRFFVPSYSANHGHESFCRACQGFFLRWDARVQFCSRRCLLAHRRKGKRVWAKQHRRSRVRDAAPIERACEHCGVTFAATRMDARFCGAACRQRAHRAA